MSKLWEVDPETRAKLLEIQKQNGNNVCVDCNAPSPQWASPKFGVFMCLNCSGIHRGLGVHISFIRSVTMDGFKVSEVKRMQMGGNQVWQAFFDSHKDNQLEGKTFEDATIKERYDSDVGEEYKERLSAKVEGRDYVPGAKPAISRSETPRSQSVAPAGPPSRTSSPAAPINPRKLQNEAYFARMGNENASRPDGVPPNQGGKYGGFGSEPAAATKEDDWLGEISRDPMAGLTKGFGWLGKNAREGYDGWIKPNVQKVAESDFTTQARLTASQLGKNLQSTTRQAQSSLSKFVEGDSGDAVSPDPDKRDFWESFGSQPQGPEKDKEEFWESFGAAPKQPDAEKRDFWDSFGDQPQGPEKGKKEFWDSFAEAGAARASQTQPSQSAVGTSAMKRTAGPGNKKDDDWNEW